MKVCVTGGRNFDDIECVHRTLNALHTEYRITDLAHGCATGADTLAASWALHHTVGVHEFRPNWKRNGKAAGPMRNHDMLNVFRPDVLVVFPGGVGTAHCVSVARAMGIPVIEAVVLTPTEARGV